MHKTIAVPIVLTGLIALTACTSGTSSSVKKEQQQQQAITKQLEQNQPVPQIKFSQLRQNLIEIKLAEAKGVQTTSFFFQMGDRNPVFSCPSIGAPIDAGDQLTNPTQVVHDNWNSGHHVLTVDQMDPTGEYASGGGNGGTYAICIDGNGDEYAQYWEGQVMTIFAPAVWDAAKGQVKTVGKPTFDFTGNK